MVRLTRDELEAAVSPKSKLLLLIIKIILLVRRFREKVEAVAEFAIKHDLIVLSDEIYESLLMTMIISVLSLFRVCGNGLFICMAFLKRGR